MVIGIRTKPSKRLRTFHESLFLLLEESATLKYAVLMKLQMQLKIGKSLSVRSFLNSLLIILKKPVI